MEARSQPLSWPRVIVTDAVARYLSSLGAPTDPVLAEMEAHGARDRIPIVVPETGALLHVLALAAGAHRIVEVGTAIGVSTLYLARALPPGGEIVSFEVDERRHTAARDYLDRAGVLDRADLRLQDARDGLGSLQPGFDMAFIDGVKAQYGDYFDAADPVAAQAGRPRRRQRPDGRNGRREPHRWQLASIADRRDPQLQRAAAS